MRILLPITLAFSLSFPALAESEKVLGNPEIDAMYAACAKVDPERGAIYWRMLRPPFSCQINQAEVSPVAPESEAYKRRYAKAFSEFQSKAGPASAGSASARGEVCGYAMAMCIEKLPAVSKQIKEQIMREWDTKALPSKPGASDISTADTGSVELVDARVPQDINALLAHPNENTRLKGLLELYKNKTRLSDDIVNRIMADRSRPVRLSITRYVYLSDRQIHELLKSGDRGAVWGLLQNPAFDLNDEHVTDILQLHVPELDRKIAQSATLSREQIQQLAAAADPETRLWIAYRYKVGSLTDSFAPLISSGNKHGVFQILSSLKPIPGQIVDMVLGHPDAELRTRLTMDGNFTPTPAQVERILRDPVPDVRIGLLRRRDVSISPQLLNEGINDHNENLAFWYRNHRDFLPTAEQTEEALSSPDIMKRRSYALMDKIKVSPAQIERGLKDPDDVVRGAFTGRKDITLTPAQLDRCTTDAAFSVRENCVERADYHMTQSRFEHILFDKNPNILFVFTGKYKEKTIDLKEFIARTLTDGSPEVQIALARNRGIKLDNAQMQAGLQSPNAKVQAAFEERANLHQ